MSQNPFEDAKWTDQTVLSVKSGYVKFKDLYYDGLTSPERIQGSWYFKLGNRLLRK